MSFLTEDDNLAVARLKLGFDALLKLKHHRAGSIDNLYMVLAGEFISLWGLSMGPQQHLDIVELAHLVVVDGDESHLTEALTLHTIMHNITEAVEFRPFGELFLGLLDGGGHSEAEATAFVYFYLNH